MTGAAAIHNRRPASSDCGSLWIELSGAELALRPAGTAWLPAQRMLVAADLHLEKGSAYAARGQLLPPYDTAETLARLEAEVAALEPRVVVLLGDSFHDARALGRLAADHALRLMRLALGRSLIWVVGNHDAALLAETGALPGDVTETARVGPLSLRHEPSSGAAGAVCGELAGHLHPCAKLVREGRSVRRRAFVTDGARLILPAFGAYAGGLNVLDAAFAGLFAGTPIAAALGSRRVHPLPVSALSGD